jgi:hypothetical protein
MKIVQKTLLVLIAALALAALVGPTSVSASGFVADEYPATATGDNPNAHVLTRGSVTYGCNSMDVTAELEEASASLAPYSVDAESCFSATGKGAVPDMNGCKLIFHPGLETAEGEFAGTFEIGPAGCGPIVIDIPNTPCMPLEIPAQAGLAATFSNGSSGGEDFLTIKANASLELIPPAHESCGGSNGTWTGSWKVTAENEANEATGIHVDQTGVYMAGEESESEAEVPRFDSEAFPVSLLGAQSGSYKFTRLGRVVTCQTVNFSAGELSEAGSQPLLDATYGGCNSSLGPVATVDTNGCMYELSVLNSGPPYVGEVGVSCPEGKEIALKVYTSQKNFELKSPLCVYSIGTQGGIAGVSYSTAGEGSERTIGIDLQLKELSSTLASGPTLICGAKAPTSTAYAGGLTLSGVR